MATLAITQDQAERLDWTHLRYKGFTTDTETFLVHYYFENQNYQTYKVASPNVPGHVFWDKIFTVPQRVYHG